MSVLLKPLKTPLDVRCNTNKKIFKSNLDTKGLTYKLKSQDYPLEPKMLIPHKNMCSATMEPVKLTLVAVVLQKRSKRLY